MKLQDYIIEATRRAADEAFRFAKSVPADKLDWHPMELGQTVLSQCKELAKTPDWATQALAPAQESSGEGPNHEEMMEAFKKETESWTTAEICHTICLEKLELFYEAVRNIPDSQLAETKWLPYDGGRDFTYAEMIEYPRWNFNYHLGQIAYIQTLYGDKEMH